MVNSQKFKRIAASGLIISIICLVIGFVIYYFASKALVNNIEDSLKEIAKQGAKIVEEDVKGDLDTLESIANIEQIRSDKVTLEEKLKLLAIEVKRKGFKRMSIADLSGNSKTTDGKSLYIGDREYFKKAVTGQKTVSDPIWSRVDGTLSVVFAVPIFNDNQLINSVLYTTHDVERLCKITDDIKMGEEGNSFIVNEEGNIIAHQNREKVYSVENVIKRVAEGQELKPLAKLIEQMAEGNTGAGEYYYEGVKKYMGYSPIKGTGWSIAVTAPKSQVFRNINNALILIILLAFIMVSIFLVTSLYTGYIRKRLGEELKQKYDELCISQEQLRKSEERFRLSAEGSNDILWDWDLKSNQMYFSERWYEVLGYQKDEKDVGYEEWESLLHPEDKASIFDTLKKHINGDIPNFSCEYRLRAKNGFYKWFFARGKAQSCESGEAVRMAGSLTDFTQQKEYEQSILKLAYFDILTGLPNRSRLRECLEMSVIGNRTIIALMFVDIDNFKFINDSYGHSMGDRVIVEVGKRISAVLEKNDIVSRQAGDEFMILLTEVGSKEDIIEHTNKILGSVHKPYDVEGIVLNISVSIGIAVFPADGNSFEELSKNADTALYKAKDMGKKNYVFFEKKMNDAIVERIVLESNLRLAIQNEEFVLYYQPQVNVVTGRVIGFEALIRWISPVLGFVSPAKFIFAAEESGLIIPIGSWVLKTACRFMKKLVDEGNNELKVSVNISVIQLMQDNFIEEVSGILEQTELDPRHLEIEITETVLMESIESNFKKLEQLRSIGVRVSLDDFGKGYSSLTYLKQLPIDTLKIDKAFVDDISNDKGLTESIVMIAHKLGLNVVAEGVETKEQLDYLTKSSCNVIQGYLISKPIPEQEASSMIGSELNI